jgi:hypothetical protein
VLSATLLGLAALAGAPAQAALSGQVTVSLIAPGGILNGPSDGLALFQLVDPGAGVEIQAGDGSVIGGSMLSSVLPEQIDFSDNSILVRVLTGAVDGNGQLVTGYLGAAPDHARYEFSGLHVPGQVITGLQLGASDGFAFSGFSGVASPTSPGAYVHLLDSSTVRFDLDTLVFKDRGNGESNNYAEFRIDLVTAPVPEPATAVLVVAGLLVLASLRRLASSRR